MKKKILLALSCAMLMGVSAAMAAPAIHQTANHETVIGAGSREAYIEHKFTPKLTVGYSWMDRDEYHDQNDYYAAYDIVGSEVKLLAGYRDKLPGDKGNAYGGVAISTPKVLGWDFYASYSAGKDFNETQVGLNKDILLNVGLNVNYHNFKPDHGSRENGVGAGINVRF